MQIATHCLSLWGRDNHAWVDSMPAWWMMMENLLKMFDSSKTNSQSLRSSKQSIWHAALSGRVSSYRHCQYYRQLTSREGSLKKAITYWWSSPYYGNMKLYGYFCCNNNNKINHCKLLIGTHVWHDKWLRHVPFVVMIKFLFLFAALWKCCLALCWVYSYNHQRSNQYTSYTGLVWELLQTELIMTDQIIEQKFWTKSILDIVIHCWDATDDDCQRRGIEQQ